MKMHSRTFFFFFDLMTTLEDYRSHLASTTYLASVGIFPWHSVCFIKRQRNYYHDVTAQQTVIFRNE